MPAGHVLGVTCHDIERGREVDFVPHVIITRHQQRAWKLSCMRRAPTRRAVEVSRVKSTPHRPTVGCSCFIGQLCRAVIYRTNSLWGRRQDIFLSMQYVRDWRLAFSLWTLPCVPSNFTSCLLLEAALQAPASSSLTAEASSVDDDVGAAVEEAV